MMGYVIPPPHDPRLSYEENLRILDRHIWRTTTLPLCFLLIGTPAAIVIGIIIAWVAK